MQSRSSDIKDAASEIGILLDTQLDMVGGGGKVKAPSGSTYYLQGGSVVGVDDAATGTCY